MIQSKHHGIEVVGLLVITAHQLALTNRHGLEANGRELIMLLQIHRRMHGEYILIG